MRLFLDSEFTALRQDARFISLALLSEDDRWFYAEFTDYPKENLLDFHIKSVLPNLFLEEGRIPEFAQGMGTTVRGTTESIRTSLLSWLESLGPEKMDVWIDVAPFDWVLFCEMFGGAMHLPGNLFYLPFDLVTLLKLRGMDPDAERESLAQEWIANYPGPKHNALFDAFLLRAIFQKMSKMLR